MDSAKAGEELTLRETLEVLGDEGSTRERLGGRRVPPEHAPDRESRFDRVVDEEGALGQLCDGDGPQERACDEGSPVERLRHEEDGLSTAEYAVGTVAVVGLGGLLIKLLTSDWFFGMLQGIFERALTSVFG